MGSSVSELKNFEIFTLLKNREQIRKSSNMLKQVEFSVSRGAARREFLAIRDDRRFKENYKG